MENIITFQAYGFFFLIVFLCFVLYGYYFHLIKSEKTGKRNYEKYGNLAINDNISDIVLEPFATNKANKESENEII